MLEWYQRLLRDDSVNAYFKDFLGQFVLLLPSMLYQLDQVHGLIDQLFKLCFDSLKPLSLNIRVDFSMNLIDRQPTLSDQ